MQKKVFFCTRVAVRTNLHCCKEKQQNDFNGAYCLGFSSPWVLWEEWSIKEAADAQEGLTSSHQGKEAKLVPVSLAFYRMGI